MKPNSSDSKRVPLGRAVVTFFVVLALTGIIVLARAQDASREGVTATAGSNDGVNLHVYLEHSNDYNVSVSSSVDYKCAGAPRERVTTSGMDDVKVPAHNNGGWQLGGACLQGRISVQRVSINAVAKTD